MMTSVSYRRLEETTKFPIQILVTGNRAEIINTYILAQQLLWPGFFAPEAIT